MSAKAESKPGAGFLVKSRGVTEMGVVLLLLCVGEVASEHARAQDTGWDCLLQDSTPEANANFLRGITFAVDRFIAVGDAGTVLVSTNGTNWLRQSTPTHSALYSVAAGEGQFVAVGDGGCILRSTDGYAWALAAPVLTNNLRSIAFGNGVFVALTDQFFLLFSSNALSWQMSKSSGPPFLTGLYFGGGLFVAYGLNGAILTSADGLNWTAANVPALTYFSCGAYGGGVFVAAGHEDFLTHPHQVAVSTDGVTWTAVPFDTPNGLWSGLCYGGGRFVGIDGGQFVCSTDGGSWGPCGQGYSPSRIMAYGLGQYVGTEGAVIYAGADPSAWTRQTPPVCPIQALAQGNGTYVGASGGTFYTSEDGVHFVQHVSSNGLFGSVTFSDGLFVASGNLGILVSADGTNWAAIAAPCLGAVSGVQYANGVWVAGCGNIISSVDATNWTVRVGNSGYVTGLIYGDNRWVACADNGWIYSSPDATNWENWNSQTMSFLGPMVFRNGLFSISREAGFMVPATAFVSCDGLHWFDASLAGPLLALQREGFSHSLTLSLAGTWGSVYSVQVSEDLEHWSEIQDITNLAGITSLTLTNLGDQGSVFIRAVSK